MDTPWFYQALFISASDHNTLWGSLWEIQMSGRVKINSSSETWVRLNWISPTYIPYPRWLAINPDGIELYSHTHTETWAWLSCSSGTSTHQNIHKHGEYSLSASVQRFASEQPRGCIPLHPEVWTDGWYGEQESREGPMYDSNQFRPQQTLSDNFFRWIWLEREFKPDHLRDSTTFSLQQKPLFWRNVR